MEETERVGVLQPQAIVALPEDKPVTQALKEKEEQLEEKLGEKLEKPLTQLKERAEKVHDNKAVRILTHITTVVILAALVILTILGWRKGIFNSPETLQAWIAGFGLAAPLIFVALQALEVGIPVIPRHRFAGRVRHFPQIRQTADVSALLRRIHRKIRALDGRSRTLCQALCGGNLPSRRSRRTDLLPRRHHQDDVEDLLAHYPAVQAPLHRPLQPRPLLPLQRHFRFWQRGNVKLV